MVSLCCVFVTEVAGWQCEIIVFIGYEVQAIGQLVPVWVVPRDYVIGWKDHGMVIQDLFEAVGLH